MESPQSMLGNNLFKKTAELTRWKSTLPQERIKKPSHKTRSLMQYVENEDLSSEYMSP